MGTRDISREHGLCIWCFERKAKPGASYCDECANYRSLKARYPDIVRTMQDYDSLQNYCPVCMDHMVISPEMLCPECRKRKEAEDKKIQNGIADRQTKHALMDIQSGMIPKVMPKLSIRERRQYGICTRCGKAFSAEGRRLCSECLKIKRTTKTYWKKREE